MGAFYCNSYEQHVSTTTQTTPTTLLHKILKRDGNGTKPEPNITTSETTTPETTIPETTTSDITTTVPNISYPPSSTEPHSYGCHLLFTDFVKRHAVDIGAVGISLAVIQVRKYCKIIA